MSEVNEKKARKAAAAAEKAKKDKAFKRNTIIVVVIAALILACALVINSDLFYTSTTAVQIGDTKYSPAEYNFYFNTVFSQEYNELYASYGELMPYILDTSLPLEDQICLFGDGTQTWADYIKNLTLSEMSNVTVLYDAAMKEGYTLTEEDQAELDELLAGYEAVASANGYSLDKYLSLNFGKGADAKLFTKLYTMQTIAGNYSQDLNDSFSYTSDELEAYYTEHKDDYDFFTYRAYFVSTGDENFIDLAEDARAAAASEAAAAIASAATPEEFAQNVRDFVSETQKATYEDDDATVNMVQGANMSSDISEWMKDPARAEGDTTVIDNDSGSYAIMYIGRDDNHYNAANVRHILINAVADENGEYSDEALAAAKEKAEQILAEYELNPTEEYFAELANTCSEDDGSNTNGGLYENVFKNQMVEEFNAFLYEEHHMPGDTAIVYGSNGYYAGYHVMYYVGEAGMLSETMAENDMRAEDYSEAVTAMAEGYKVSEGFGMRFAG